MSFYSCDNCNNHINYSGKIEAEYEITKLDLRFCSYSCLAKYFKNIGDE